MNRFSRFATQHPYLFSILITLMVLVFYIFAAVLAEVVGNNRVQKNLIEASGRTAGAFAASLSPATAGSRAGGRGSRR